MIGTDIRPDPEESGLLYRRPRLEDYIAFMAPLYLSTDRFPHRIEWTSEKIKVTREDIMGWTQEQFAQPAGVSVQTIFAWEHDQRKDKTAVGKAKLQNSLNRSLNPIYQAIIDEPLNWATVPGYGTGRTFTRLWRTLNLEDGDVRNQIGDEFYGLFIPTKGCEHNGPFSYWEHQDRYVRSVRR